MSLFKISYDVSGQHFTRPVLADDLNTAFAYVAASIDGAHPIASITDSLPTVDTTLEVPTGWKIPMLDDEPSAFTLAERNLIAIAERQWGIPNEHKYMEYSYSEKTYTFKSDVPLWQVEDFLQDALRDMNISRTTLNATARYFLPTEVEHDYLVAVGKGVAIPRPVAAIEYLSSDGAVMESVVFTDTEEFVEKAKKENYYGVPMGLVFYKDSEGKTISRDFVSEMDPPPQSVRIVDVFTERNPDQTDIVNEPEIDDDEPEL